MLARICGPFFIAAGINHFVNPRFYLAIMPDYLPAHQELVDASGIAEMAGGAALLHPATRRFGGWWLIATLIAVFPANLHMALHPERYRTLPRAGLYARLPVQLLFIAWVRGAART
ncbi:MAG: hypothetical protein JWM60_2624 [Solirubrobacterales bacterium]|nr:hypothetical protein [Solirubrobacterales bacterium]